MTRALVPARARASRSLIVRARHLALLAASLIGSARAQIPRASVRFDLAQAWVAVCQAPCLVRTLGSFPAQIVIAASPPTGDDPPATVLTLTQESGLPITVGTAYARALSNTTRVVVMPYAIGGGGDASAANQEGAIASLGTDGAGPPALPGGATGVRGWLRSIAASLSGVLTTTPAGVTRTRVVCTLPAYASGGTVVCTDATGAQTTTACAANTACLVSPANPGRKVAEFTNRTAGSTIDVGYSASVAPGNAKGYDGPGAIGGQGGSGAENPAHVGAYYAATVTANAVLVFVQGH